MFNPVFIFLVIIGAVILWFLLSILFIPIGSWISRILKDTNDIITKNEEEKKKNE